VVTLVTGAAGFIGMHFARRLLEQGQRVVGVDNLAGQCDLNLKQDRIAQLSSYPGFKFHHLDLGDARAAGALFESVSFSNVVHLAAQTGVRHSLKDPHACIMSNVVAFANILENCRSGKISHLVYASSSSIYGVNCRLPYSEHHPADHPVSLYAATKKSNELLAHTYSHVYALPTTGLRFFTVYGPWGRPDMAPVLFADAILHGRPIKVFNEGKMLRDFTYVDDVVESMIRVLGRPATPNPEFDARSPDPATSNAPYRIYNIGNQQPVELMAFIGALENALGLKAKKILCPMQSGDVIATCADTHELEEAIQWTPGTPLATGIERFVDWFRGYYRRSHAQPQC
jgi:UDP-glucuronate 4-epimerase